MMKMQEETKAVYEKYGVSQMGGCVQMLIQMPILLALLPGVQIHTTLYHTVKESFYSISY